MQWHNDVSAAVQRLARPKLFQGPATISAVAPQFSSRSSSFLLVSTAEATAPCNPLTPPFAKFDSHLPLPAELVLAASTATVVCCRTADCDDANQQCGQSNRRAGPCVGAQPPLLAGHLQQQAYTHTAVVAVFSANVVRGAGPLHPPPFPCTHKHAYQACIAAPVPPSQWATHLSAWLTL